MSGDVSVRVRTAIRCGLLALFTGLGLFLVSQLANTESASAETVAPAATDVSDLGSGIADRLGDFGGAVDTTVQATVHTVGGVVEAVVPDPVEKAVKHVADRVKHVADRIESGIEGSVPSLPSTPTEPSAPGEPSAPAQPPATQPPAPQPSTQPPVSRPAKPSSGSQAGTLPLESSPIRPASSFATPAVAPAPEPAATALDNVIARTELTSTHPLAPTPTPTPLDDVVAGGGQQGSGSSGEQRGGVSPAVGALLAAAIFFVPVVSQRLQQRDDALPAAPTRDIGSTPG